MDQPAPEQETKPNLEALEKRIALLERVVGRLSKAAGLAPAVVPPSPELDKSVEGTPASKPMPTADAAVSKKSSAELEIGQKWLSLVGIILIFLSAFFFVRFVFQYLGPGGKVGLSYLGAVGLFAVAALTHKKYKLFSAIVAAGAWAVTYLVTYAMHFFEATRIITEPFFAMILIIAVVAALFLAALHTKSKSLVLLGLILGFFTMVISPLSMFSVIGTVALLGAMAILAVRWPWGDLLLPAGVGAAVAYLAWFGQIAGELSAQGGGLLEKQLIALIALVVMWLFVAVALLMRKDEEQSLGGHVDVLTMILTSLGVTLAGLAALVDLTLVFTTLRQASGIWLFLLAGLHAGWALIGFNHLTKKDSSVVASIFALALTMASIAYLFPEQSGGTAVVWAGLGLFVVIIGLLRHNSYLAAVTTIPLIGSAVRFISVDMQKDAVELAAGSSLNLLLGIVISVVIIGSAAMMRSLDLSTLKDKRAKHVPGSLLVTGLIVVFAILAQEFTGAMPSIFWGLIGLATVAGGFFGRWADARIIGLLALATTVARVFIHDLSDLEALPRVISFAILGAVLLLLGYAYNHYKDTLQRYLQEDEL